MDLLLLSQTLLPTKKAPILSCLLAMLLFTGLSTHAHEAIAAKNEFHPDTCIASVE